LQKFILFYFIYLFLSCFADFFSFLGSYFYGLAVKTVSIALQKFFFFSFLVCGKKFVILGQNIFFQIRLKKQM